MGYWRIIFILKRGAMTRPSRTTISNTTKSWTSLLVSYFRAKETRMPAGEKFDYLQRQLQGIFHGLCY
jgi:hypothetical protein